MIRLANQVVSSSQCIFTSNDKALLLSYAVLWLRKLEKLLSTHVAFPPGWSKSSSKQSGLTKTCNVPISRQPSRTCYFPLFPAIPANRSTEGISKPGILNCVHFTQWSQTCSIFFIPAGTPVLHTTLLAWLLLPLGGESIASEWSWQKYSVGTGKI